MENIKQSESKKMQLPALDPNKTRLGGSGGLAVVSGIAGGVAKGAFNLIKSVLKGGVSLKLIFQETFCLNNLYVDHTRRVYLNPAKLCQLVF